MIAFTKMRGKARRLGRRGCQEDLLGLTEIYHDFDLCHVGNCSGYTANGLAKTRI